VRLLVTSLKNTAEAATGHPINKAVISVGWHCNRAGREQIVEGCKGAGIEVVGFVNTTASAMLASQLERNISAAVQSAASTPTSAGTSEKSEHADKVLVVNSGACSTVAIFGRSSTGGYSRLAYRSSWLGGDQFTELLVTHFEKEFTRRVG
jgi:molecular chaperone DnaK (HSP70)